jgi:glycosyltransferase involved in cell wall biosynthesis
LKSILHIITGLENGGAEAVLFRLLTNDKQNRHTVISMMGMGKYGPMLEQNGLQVFSLDMPKGKVTFKGIKLLWKLVGNIRPDIIQTWMYHADLIGGVIGRLRGIRNIYWCIHNSTLVRGLTASNTLWVTRICATLSYVVPKKIISCATKAMEVNISQGYSAKKFCLVPNGYDLAHFKPDEEEGKKQRGKWQIAKSTFLIGMVARFDPQKDVLNLIRALNIMLEKGTDFHVVLVGSGMDTNNTMLNDWLNENGIENNVTLVGQHDDIPLVMNAIDLLVLSSKYGEAFPNVLCEAMACGTPCVATDVGDSAFIIGDTGWVVPPQSSQLLARSILEAEKAWADDEIWNAISENTRNRIQVNFGIQRMVEGYRQVWGL